jgi:hypothetical protein
VQKKKKENVSTTIIDNKAQPMGMCLYVFIAASISVCSSSVMPAASRRFEAIHQHLPDANKRSEEDMSRGKMSLIQNTPIKASH